MKAILLSIRPEHLVNILNGKKTIEIMKNVLHKNIPVYLYCTKGKPYLFMSSTEKDFLKACNADIYLLSNLKPIRDILNGKVVAKCEFMEVEEIAYAYHISNLEIFDTPKELSEFNRCDGFIDCYCSNCKYYPLSNNMGVNCKYRPLTKAPKSWCYVEEFK